MAKRNIMPEDEFFDIIDEHMEHLQKCYKLSAEIKPVLELSLPFNKIFAFSYSEYSKCLNARSWKILKQQYSDALKNNEMVVFVKHYEKKTVKSAAFPISEI